MPDSNPNSTSTLTLLLPILSEIIGSQSRQFLRHLRVNQMMLYKSVNKLLDDELDAGPAGPLYNTLQSKFGQSVSFILDNSAKISPLIIGDEELGRIANKVSWPYVQVIGLLPKKSQQFFYTWLAAEYNLSLTQLQQRINENDYEVAIKNPKKLIERMGKPASPLFKKLDLSLLEDNGRILSLCLTEIANNPLQDASFLTLLQAPQPENIDVHNESLSTLYKVIADFSLMQQKIANNFYNTLCWHVGNAVVQYRPACSTDVLQELALQLTSTYGNGFSFADLSSMVEFAQLFPEPNEIYQVTYLVTWPHIRLILPLNNKVEILFYAKYCAQNGVPAHELTTVLSDHLNHQLDNNVAGKLLENRIVKLVIGSKSNTQAHITEIRAGQDGVDYNPGVGNVFTETYFVNFITAINPPN